MKIFQIEFSKLGTSEHALDWITLPESKGGRNDDRYWIIRTDIQVNNPQNDLAMHRLMLFLHNARENDFQTVQIMKNV